MSEGKKDEKKDVGGSVDGFGGFLKGGISNKEKLIESTITVNPDTLPMVTEIKNPQVMAVADMLVEHGDSIGYKKTAGVGRAFLLALRINMVSHNRKRAKEFFDAWVSIMVQDQKQKQDRLDELFGGRR